MRELLIRQNLPPNWIASIVDSKGKVIARTAEHEKFIGTLVRPGLLKRMQEVNEDSVESVTLNGTPVFSAFSHSPLSKWSIVIGFPAPS